MIGTCLAVTLGEIKFSPNSVNSLCEFSNLAVSVAIKHPLFSIPLVSKKFSTAIIYEFKIFVFLN